MSKKNNKISCLVIIRAESSQRQRHLIQVQMPNAPEVITQHLMHQSEESCWRSGKSKRYALKVKVHGVYKAYMPVLKYHTLYSAYV